MARDIHQRRWLRPSLTTEVVAFTANRESATPAAGGAAAVKPSDILSSFAFDPAAAAAEAAEGAAPANKRPAPSDDPNSTDAAPAGPAAAPAPKRAKPSAAAAAKSASGSAKRRAGGKSGKTAAAAGASSVKLGFKKTVIHDIGGAEYFDEALTCASLRDGRDVVIGQEVWIIPENFAEDPYATKAGTLPARVSRFAAVPGMDLVAAVICGGGRYGGSAKPDRLVLLSLPDCREVGSMEIPVDEAAEKARLLARARWSTRACGWSWAGTLLD